MKKLILYLVLLHSALSLKGQNAETDSLKRLMDTIGETPQKVLVLEGLSYAYLSAYPDTALQYALRGLKLAKEIKYKIGESYCTNALGNVYFSIGDYSSALEMYLKSLKMKEELKNQKQAIAVTYFNIANVYTEQEDYKHALYYLFKTKQVDEKSRDSAGILFDLYSLSSIYLRMKNTDSALHYGQKAYQMALRLNDKNLVGAIVNNLGEIYASLNNLPLAKNYYNQSISYVKEIKDNQVLTADYIGLAKIHKQGGKPDSSVYYAKEALYIAQEAPFYKEVLEVSTLLADLYKNIDQFDSAFKYQALNIATKDSLFNGEKVKKVQNLKLLEMQREQSMESAKSEYRNKIKLYFVIFVSLVLLLIAILLWRNNKQKQKAFVMLQQQKEIADNALEELKATQAQLIQREKMASLGELIAGIAHEIQNPLNFVNNFAEVSEELADELKIEATAGNKEDIISLASSIKENLGKIAFHGKRADTIVKSMMEHSRSSAGQKEPVEINSLVDEYLRLAYHGIRAKNKSFNVKLQSDFDGNAGMVNIVPQNIGRVLLNLFNNAFYSVAEKSKLNLTGFDPQVSVSTRRLNEWLEIIIVDNGLGVPQKLRDKIFQPFFTTKPPGEGTGLGLSLSYDIITKEHGGEIRLESMEGEFAKFTILLPCAV